ncbi:MAG: BLUF domain-containing protein [Rhodobacterales bacterium]|nr:BLUF domain-containing protein [Rhodobacterales bacterium]
MGLAQIVYTSQPFAFDEATLGNLLVIARRNNTRDDISGALICRRDIFVQMLEGPEAALEATFGRIARDDRHLNITRHLVRPVTRRMFGQWSMLHDPAQSWLWPEAAVRDGVPVGVDGAAICEVFRMLAIQAKSDQVKPDQD